MSQDGLPRRTTISTRTKSKTRSPSKSPDSKSKRAAGSMMRALKFAAQTVSTMARAVEKAATDARRPPIFEAAAEGDVSALCRAYAEGEDLWETDLHSNTVLHFACMHNCQPSVRAILVLAGEQSRMWERTNDEGKTPAELTTSDMIVEDLAAFREERPEAVRATDFKRNEQIIRDKTAIEDVSHERVLLSLDGGGIRGLVELQIMLHIENRLGFPLADLVDWVAGTSTGSILALALAQKKPVVWGHQLYFGMVKTIFKPATRGIIPRYDAKELERMLQKHLGTGTMEGMAKNVIVTSSDTRSLPPKLVLFRSYAPRVSQEVYQEEGFQSPSTHPAWVAARASSAAPVYFSPYVLDRQILADGALCSNNPSSVLLADFFKVRKIEEMNGVENRDRVFAFISIGTGRDPANDDSAPVDVSLCSYTPQAIYDSIKRSTNLITMFIRQANYLSYLIFCTNSDGHVIDFPREWALSHGIPFFRLQPRLSNRIKLDETDYPRIVEMLWQTEMQLRSDLSQWIGQLVKLLQYLHAKRMDMSLVTATTG